MIKSIFEQLTLVLISKLHLFEALKKLVLIVVLSHICIHIKKQHIQHQIFCSF